MKNSIENIMAELALRSLMNEDPERFLRRAAVAVSSNDAKRSFFYGRITRFVTPTGEREIDRLWNSAKSQIWNDADRAAAVRLSGPIVSVCDSGLSLRVVFKYNTGSEDQRKKETSFTVYQEQELIDMFEIEND